jgi:NADPH2 dehydrogenase
MTTYRRLATFKTSAQFLEYAASVGAELPFDENLEHGSGAPLAQPCVVDGGTVGNRFAILPMEGWDGTRDGRPSELTIRRWRRFGASGAKLIWGGEAVAVRHDGRANPNQLLSTDDTTGDLARLRQTLVAEHASHFGRTDDLLISLQLTHSGRFSRPDGPAAPVIAYRHPVLDRKQNLSADYPVLTDDEIARIVEAFVAAARRAQQAGYAFVDLKHCHGYLGHEILSAVDRPGRYGGAFENRTLFLREIVSGIRAEAPGLGIAVRLSAADTIPYRSGADRTGEPEPADNKYPFAFGGDGTGLGIDLREPKAFIDLLALLDIRLLCVSLGSPYYTPHLIRPAYFPPSDGYLPPEDPLVGVARHLAVTAELKRHRPEMIVVGSGYTYLQQWLPHVAQAVLRRGEADFVGLGRMVLSYPELPSDVLTGKPLQWKHLCRTFSDCTTAPRNGLVSGCYPLDRFYKELPEAEKLSEIKRHA